MGILDHLLPWRAHRAGRKAAANSLNSREREQRLRANSMLLNQVRHYQSAVESRRRPGWDIFSLSADAEAVNVLPTIRSRARLMSDNDPKAGGLVHKDVVNTIGPRFSVQARIPERTRRLAGIDESRAKEIVTQAEEYWRDVVAVPGNMDVDWRRLRSFLAYVHLMFRHVKVDGGLFLRFIFKPGGSRTIPFACRIIEPECIGTPPKLQGAKNIRSGLEFNGDGELVAFYVANQHPGDILGSGLSYERVPVRNELGLPQMVFYFNPNRETASREMPWMQRILVLLNDVADYKDSELQRKKMEADIAWYCKLNDPDAAQDAFEGDSAFGNPDGQTLKRSQVTHPKRQIQYLEANEEIDVVDADRPGSNYQPFLDSHDRDIGQGVGRSFERVSNNYGSANFSATRVSGIEDYVEHETEFALFAPVVFNAMWQWAMWALSVEVGDPSCRLVQPSWQRYIKPSWSPGDDADAATERMTNLTSSLVEECGALGRDWETVVENAIRVERYRREARQREGLPDEQAQSESIDQAVEGKVKDALKQQEKQKENEKNPPASDGNKEDDNE